MVVHQQLYTRHIPRLLARGHLAHEVVHPEHEAAHHREELEQVAGVVQLALARITQGLRVHGEDVRDELL